MTGKSFPLFLLLFLSLGLGPGCSSRLNRGGEVRGTVRLNGEPVTAGNVLLYSEDGEFAVAGAIRGDGTYVVHEPPLGKVRIAVQTRMFRTPLPAPARRTTNNRASQGIVLPDACERGLIYKPIPEKYERVETTDLTWTVPLGQQTYDIELSRKEAEAGGG